MNKKIVLGTSGPPAYRGFKYDAIFLLLTKLSLKIHKVLEGLRAKVQFFVHTVLVLVFFRALGGRFRIFLRSFFYSLSYLALQQMSVGWI